MTKRVAAASLALLVGCVITIGIQYGNAKYVQHANAEIATKGQEQQASRCIDDWHQAFSVTEDLRSFDYKGLQELYRAGDPDKYQLFRDLDRTRNSFVAIQARLPSDESVVDGASEWAGTSAPQNLHKARVQLETIVADLNMMVPVGGDWTMARYVATSNMTGDEQDALLRELLMASQAYARDAEGYSSAITEEAAKCVTESKNAAALSARLSKMNTWEILTQP